MDSVPVIEVRELTKIYRVRRRGEGLGAALKAFLRPQVDETVAVRDINLVVGEGEALAFIGPNGAGKSTTIKMLTGILHPSGGSATVLGLVPWEKRQQLAFSIGSVFGQKSQLWYHLPPAETFNLLAKIYELDPSRYRRRRAFLIEMFEIEEYLHTPVRKLSLGQRMRCELAAALLHEPRIIFLDEPTIGLDLVARQRIRELIKRMNREDRVTLFLTSHDVGDVERVCKRVIVVNHGTVVYDNSLDFLRRHYVKTKILDLKLDEEVEDFDYPGVRLLKSTPVGMKLEVDASHPETVEALLGHLLSRHRILDVNISDPPLERIISGIYAGSGLPGHEEVRGSGTGPETPIDGD